MVLILNPKIKIQQVIFTAPKKVIGKKDTEPTLEINTEKVEIKKGRSK